MRLPLLVAVLATLALPRAVPAQSCIGSPVDAAMIGARAIVASGWLGGGARAAVASNLAHIAVEADLLSHDNGADARIGTLRLGIEGASTSRICAFTTGSLFSSAYTLTMGEYDPVNDVFVHTDTLVPFNGRVASIGVGFGHWVYGSSVDVLLHAAAEGVLMKRERTGDGALAYTFGAGLSRARLFIGAAFRDSTPFDAVLERQRSGAPRLILHVAWELGR